MIATLPDDATNAKVSYTKPDGSTGEATLTKDSDGNWTSDNPAVSVDGNKVTVPDAETKDDTDVTVVASNNNGDSPEATLPAPNVTAPPKPAIEAEGGDVAATLPDTATEAQVSYTKPDGSKGEATLTKDSDGSWTSNNPAVSVDGNKVTVPDAETKDGTDVTVVASNNNGDSPEATLPAPDVTAPSAPVFSPQSGGGLEITLPDDATKGEKVKVSFTKEDGSPVDLVFTKGDGDQEWSLTGGESIGLPSSVNANSVTIDANNILDGSTISGSSTTADGVDESEALSAIASPDNVQKVIDDVGADTGEITPSSDNKVETDDATPELVIDKEIPNKVILYVDGNEVQSTYDPVKGTLTPNNPLDLGEHTLTYAIKDESRDVTSEPSEPLVVNVLAPKVDVAQGVEEAFNPDSDEGKANIDLGSTVGGIGDVYVDGDSNPFGLSNAAYALQKGQETLNGGEGQAGYKLTFEGGDDVVYSTSSFGAINRSGKDSSAYSIETNDGNDIVISGRDIGTGKDNINGEGPDYTIDTGSGDDFVAVGISNKDFALAKDRDGNIIFVKASGGVAIESAIPEGATLLNNINNSRVTGDAIAGGRIGGANINLGEGNDVLTVEGVGAANSEVGVFNSNINLGAGNDRFILADNYGIGGISGDYNGFIGYNTIVTGSDNNFIKGPGITDNAKITLGSGEDVLDFTYIEKGVTINTGGGNDSITANSVNTNSSSHINMGEGDDTFIYTGNSRIDADGEFTMGDGNDTLVLTGENVWLVPREDFNGTHNASIENFVINTSGDKTLLNLKLADLVDGTAQNPIYTTEANEQGKHVVTISNLDSLGNAHKATVDFGEWQKGGLFGKAFADKSLGQEYIWQQTGQVTHDDGHSYSVYKIAGGAFDDLEVHIMAGSGLNVLY